MTGASDPGRQTRRAAQFNGHHFHSEYYDSSLAAEAEAAGFGEGHDEPVTAVLEAEEVALSGARQGADTAR